MAKIEILPDNKVFDVDEDKTLLENALQNNIPHANACGGHGKCSTCRIWLLEGVEHCEEKNDDEKKMAESLRFGPEIRLACQTRIKGDVKYRRLVIDDADLELTNQRFEHACHPIGQEKEVAILFTDIRGFTSFSERHPPYDVLFILNRHFNQMSKIVDCNGGMIDNYVGDSLFAIFGMDNEEDAILKAVKSGVEMLAEVDKMKSYMLAMYQENFEIGIGVHYGKVVAGEIGTGKKIKKTVIGDNVNLASRIESANKEAGTRFLVSETVYKKVEKEVISNDFVRIRMPGKEEKFTLYEINGLTPKAQESSQNENPDIIHKNGFKFQKLMLLKEIPKNSQKEIIFKNTEILLIHNADEIFAIESRCPHMNLPFKDSKIKNNCEIECKWHHSGFEIQTGKKTKWCDDLPLLIKAFGLAKTFEGTPQRDIKTFPLLIENDDIWICLDF